jgi:hypothetical protein
MSQDSIEEIKKIGEEGLTSNEGAPPEKVEGVANRDYFDSLMMQRPKEPEFQQTQVAKVQQTEAASEANKKHPSLMEQVAELNKKVDNVKKVQPTDIIAQAQDVMSQMQQIKDQLALPDQSIKPSYRKLLDNKLNHINDNLRIALSAAGVENVPPPKSPISNNPIERFLGFLTDGQAQLGTVAKEVHALNERKGNMSAASMLAVQIKVGFIQHELEFFSSVLNKALESTKTIMNVQV